MNRVHRITNYGCISFTFPFSLLYVVLSVIWKKRVMKLKKKQTKTLKRQTHTYTPKKNNSSGLWETKTKKDEHLIAIAPATESNKKQKIIVTKITV